MSMQNREQLVSDDFRSASQLGSNKDSGQSANPELKQRMEQLRLQREIVGVLITSFVWKLLDSQMILPKSVLNISNDRRSIYLKEEDYFFRTFFGDVGFNEGIHYWEIVADAKTEHELKIGVSKSKDCD